MKGSHILLIVISYFVRLVNGAAIRLTTVEDYDALVNQSNRSGILLYANSDTVYGIKQHGPEFDALSDIMVDENHEDFYVGIVDCVKYKPVCRAGKVKSTLAIAAYNRGKPTYYKTKTDNMNTDSYLKWVEDLGLLEEEEAKGKDEL